MTIHQQQQQQQSNVLSEVTKEEQLKKQADDEKNRFTIELEFIQCFANPHYRNAEKFFDKNGRNISLTKYACQKWHTCTCRHVENISLIQKPGIFKNDAILNFSKNCCAFRALIYFQRFSYLHFLAQNGYFKEDSMIKYLDYLNYWRKPEYARHLRYPQCNGAWKDLSLYVVFNLFAELIIWAGIVIPIHPIRVINSYGLDGRLLIHRLYTVSSHMPRVSHMRVKE